MDDITWPEARGILQELVTVFESNDDIESIKEVRSLMGMVEEAYEWKEESAKKIIQGENTSINALRSHHHSSPWQTLHKALLLKKQEHQAQLPWRKSLAALRRCSLNEMLYLPN